MSTRCAVLDTVVAPNIVRSDMLLTSWRQNIVPLAHLPRLGDANGRAIKLLGIVVLRFRLGNSHFCTSFIITKHLTTTMILSLVIGTEFLDRHVSAIRCMEGAFETIGGTVRTFCQNRPTVDAVEADVDKPRPPGVKPPNPEKEAISSSSIRAAQKI